MPIASAEPKRSTILVQKPTLLDSIFAMRNCSFQGAGEGIYLVGNEQARAVESTIYRAKIGFR